MFTQDPHPLYQDLLCQSYTIKKVQDSKMWEWNTRDNQLFVNCDLGILHILDRKNEQQVTFEHVDFYFSKDVQNDYKEIIECIKEYTRIVNTSLDKTNIELMKIILSEIKYAYPDIETLDMRPFRLKGQMFYRAYDQNNFEYIITDKSISGLILNFYFIRNLTLDYFVSLENISNHELLENMEKYSSLKKDLKIDLKIIKKDRL